MKGIKKGICSTKQKRQSQVITSDDGEQIKLPLTKHRDIYMLKRHDNEHSVLARHSSPLNKVNLVDYN